MEIRIRFLSISFSFLLHLIGILLIFLLCGRYKEVENPQKIFIASIVEIPKEKIYTPAKKTISNKPSYVSRLKKKITPAIKRKRYLREFNVKRKEFSPSSYRKKLMEKLGNFEVKKSKGDFSYSKYIKEIEEKLSMLKREGREERKKNYDIPKIENIKFKINPVPSIEKPSLPLPLWYLRIIRERIEENWNLPESLKLMDESAIVSFRIYKDGKISEPVFEKPARWSSFNKSVLNAIKKSSPFPPLPESINRKYIEVTVEFTGKGLR